MFQPVSADIKKAGPSQLDKSGFSLSLSDILFFYGPTLLTVISPLPFTQFTVPLFGGIFIGFLPTDLQISKLSLLQLLPDNGDGRQRSYK